MRALPKAVLILLVLCAALLAAGFVYDFCISSGGLPAGIFPVSGSAEAALKDEWVEIGADDPARLTIRGHKFSWKNYWGEDGSCGFTVEDSSDGGKTLRPDGAAPFETLEYRTDGERAVLSATIMELDGRGQIVTEEFARSSEIDDFPADYVSTLAQERNNREPEPTSVALGLYGDTELSAYFALLGTPAAETDINPDALQYLNTGYAADVEGLLYGAAASGTFRFTGEEDGCRLREISLTVYDLTYDELRGNLAEQYGEPQEEGEEPYAEINGGAVAWCIFGNGTAGIKISAPSEWDYVELTAELPDA